MAEQTKIQWTDHTFNPWRGCTKVHEGCANCYAEATSKRNPQVLGVWGPQGQRVVASNSYWNEPLKWNRSAEREGVRRRVFCASLADVFEDWHQAMRAPNGKRATVNPDGTFGDTDLFIGRDIVMMDDARRRLFDVIDQTPHLIWQLLTKRPENIERMWPAIRYDGAERVINVPCKYRENVWLGTSVSDQATFDKYASLLVKSKTLVPVLFLSAEPLLGPIDLSEFFREHYQARRRVGVSGGFSGGPSDRQTRSDLEGSKKGVGSLGGMRSVEALQESQGGEETAIRLSNGQGDVRQPADVSSCASPGVEASSRSAASRDDNQSQKRSKERQSPIESGADDQVAEFETRRQGTQNQPVCEPDRHAESRSEAGVSGSSGNSSQEGVGREPVEDCNAVLDISAARIENSQERATGIWLIIGGESGPGARKAEMSWYWSLLQQCADHNVPAFMKQLGSGWDTKDKKGGDPAEWEPGLGVRQFPEGKHATLATAAGTE